LAKTKLTQVYFRKCTLSIDIILHLTGMLKTMYPSDEI
jgi:hypothetical protein